MPTTFFWRLFTLILVCGLLSCQNRVDIASEKEKIQKLMDQVHQAHFSKDANEFYAPYGESWYDVRRGQLEKITKTEAIEGTQAYLDKMEFQELSDTHERIIEVSKDGSMASYLGAVTVKGMYDDRPVFWVVSWQSVLRKTDDNWSVISTANTEASKEVSAKVILDRAKEWLGDFTEVYSISALADCRAPEGPFKTLLFSRKTDGRMEQIYGDAHIVLKHGEESSWTYNIKAKRLNEDPGTSLEHFVMGHELHWLSFRPEDRFSGGVFDGVIEFKGKNAFKVKFIDAQDQPVHFYYSFEDYSPLGFELFTNKPDAMVGVTFGDWREQSGLQLFYAAEFLDGEERFQYNFKEITLNALQDNDFESKEIYLKG